VPVRLFGVSGRGRQGQEEGGLQEQAGLIRKELLIVQRGRTSGRMKVQHEVQKRLKASLPHML
jgi:hypothetical protein